MAVTDTNTDVLTIAGTQLRSRLLLCTGGFRSLDALAAALEVSGSELVTVALRQRTTIAVLRVKDDVIVLQTMMWPDEVRTPDFSVETGDVKDAEVKMAHMLVETLAGDFDPSEFEDDYAGAVETLVKTKIEGGEIKQPGGVQGAIRQALDQGHIQATEAVVGMSGGSVIARRTRAARTRGPVRWSPRSRPGGTGGARRRWARGCDRRRRAPVRPGGATPRW